MAVFQSLTKSHVLSLRCYFPSSLRPSASNLSTVVDSRIELDAAPLSAEPGQPALDYPLFASCCNSFKLHLSISLSRKSSPRGSNPHPRGPKPRALPLSYAPPPDFCPTYHSVAGMGCNGEGMAGHKPILVGHFIKNRSSNVSAACWVSSIHSVRKPSISNTNGSCA